MRFLRDLRHVHENIVVPRLVGFDKSVPLFMEPFDNLSPFYGGRGHLTIFPDPAIHRQVKQGAVTRTVWSFVPPGGDLEQKSACFSAQKLPLS